MKPVPPSARADREEHFFAEGILELLKLERGFTFVAKHFEHGWPALLRHLNAAILEVNDVHLQRLDLEVSVVAAMRTGQSHSDSLTPVGA